MINLLLVIHILGAIILGVIVILAWINLFKSTSDTYISSARHIGIGAGFELITGALLAVHIQSYSGLLQYCSKLFIYLGIILFTEIVLLYRMKNHEMTNFRTRIAFSMLAAGIIINIAAIFHILTKLA